jgi:hypothetical protein
LRSGPKQRSDFPNLSYCHLGQIVSTPALSVLALVLLPGLLLAQGVTTAAMEGTVLREDGSPIVGATVRVTNESNGRRWEVVTSSSGRYVFEAIAVGGPYRIEVRAPGFAPAARAGNVLALGQRLHIDFALQHRAIELPPLTVTATVNPVLNPSRTGPAEIISKATIAELPNPDRDFLALSVLSPQVALSPSSRTAPTGGITIGAQNRLLNAFHIDGGVNYDLYTGRLPGRETLPRPISLEALEEIQVLAAPFDVRHGGFAGGVVNALTKSGTNSIDGSAFVFLADGALVGRSATGADVGDFTTWQFGGSLGGPIARDRAHYFLSGDVQRRAVPDPGPLIVATGAPTPGIGISYASAVRFQEILRNTFGLDPGTLGPVHGHAPAQDVFGKITMQLGTNSHLEVSHHYAHGDRRGFLERLNRDYLLSSADRQEPSTANASRLIWTELFGGRWSNELIVSYLDLRDECRPSVTYPRIVVDVDQGRLLAGTPVVCPSTFSQRTLEVTENLSRTVGAHLITVGAHGELLHFEDDLLQTSAGLWNFRNLDSLEAGVASHYERALPGPLSTGGVDFHVRQIGAYMQDRWTATRSLTLTVGLRVDVPILPDAVATNESLRAALGIDTGQLPSGHALWSPRLAINYNLGAMGRTFLRAGVGVFSGRPPYTWIGNAYRDNGAQELFVVCDGAQVPAFDPVNQPATCTSTRPRPRLSFFDPNVRFPQNLKVALGVDHQLAMGVVGTVDVLDTRAVHQLYLSDANLLPPGDVAEGEGGRPLYGTISPSGVPAPARRDPALGQVIRVANGSGDHALLVSARLRKQFGDRAEASLLYAHTRARDRMSLVNFPARANLEHTPLDGTLEDRRTRTSFFETPHRLLVSALVRLPYRMRVSLLYAGASGTSYTYVIDRDANADGIGRGPLKNDIVYVPRDSMDIALVNPAEWASLDAFILAEPCLREQRGRILERNSCRNPWSGVLNARLTRAFPTVAGQSMELTADAYNVLNLIRRSWGRHRVTTPSLSVPLLRLDGYDAGRGRGVYRLTLPERNQVQDLESRWQVQLGLRYVF